MTPLRSSSNPQKDIKDVSFKNEPDLVKSKWIHATVFGPYRQVQVELNTYRIHVVSQNVFQHFLSMASFGVLDKKKIEATYHEMTCPRTTHVLAFFQRLTTDQKQMILKEVFPADSKNLLGWEKERVKQVLNIALKEFEKAMKEKNPDQELINAKICAKINRELRQEKQEIEQIAQKVESIFQKDPQFESFLDRSIKQMEEEAIESCIPIIREILLDQTNKCFKSDPGYGLILPHLDKISGDLVRDPINYLNAWKENNAPSELKIPSDVAIRFYEVVLQTFNMDESLKEKGAG